VETVIQDKQPCNPEGQPRWDRFERADLFEQYRVLRTQGISERQAAKELKVPRTTLQAWRLWHDTSSDATAQAPIPPRHEEFALNLLHCLRDQFSGSTGRRSNAF
jgi:hypothetical protein